MQSSSDNSNQSLDGTFIQTNYIKGFHANGSQTRFYYWGQWYEYTAEFSTDGIPYDPARQWAFFIIRSNLDLSASTTDDQEVHIRIYRSKSNLENGAPSQFMDNNMLKNSVLHKCTNLDQTKRHLRFIDMTQNQTNNTTEDFIRLKTSECTFSGIKTVLISKDIYLTLSSTNLDAQDQKLTKFFKYLMIGGFSDLIDRINFYNMDTRIFKKIMQGKFRYDWFKDISDNFDENRGLNISGEGKGEFSILPHCWHKLFEDKHKMRAGADPSNPYVFKEMSSSIKIFYRVEPPNQWNITNFHEILLNYDYSGSTNFERQSSSHFAILKIKIKTERIRLFVSNDSNGVPQYSYNQFHTVLYEIIQKNSDDWESIDKELIPRTWSSQRYTLSDLKLTIMPVDLAFDINDNIGIGRQPRVTVLIQMRLRTAENTNPVLYHNLIETYGKKGVNLNLQTRWFLTSYEGTVNQKIEVHDIFFHHGSAGLEVFQSLLPTAEYYQRQSLPTLQNQRLHVQVSEQGSCFLRSAFEYEKCDSCKNNSWYDPDAQSCKSCSTYTHPVTGNLKNCFLCFNATTCRRCINTPYQDDHYFDMFRRGQCHQQVLGCPSENGFFQFTTPEDIYRTKGRECLTCPENCKRCLIKGELFVFLIKKELNQSL